MEMFLLSFPSAYEIVINLVDQEASSRQATTGAKQKHCGLITGHVALPKSGGLPNA
jgi:hypothetical protein